MADQYEPFDNFTTRLRVETTFAKDDVRDHRTGEFTKQEYFRNNQQKKEVEEETPAGFPPMKSVTRAPRKKTKAELEIEEANAKDLKNRSLK